MSAQSTQPPAAPENAPALLVLRVGSRVELGAKRGKVDVLRGAGREPYEVRIVWDGKKYPEWFLRSTLKFLHQEGSLRVL